MSLSGYVALDYKIWNSGVLYLIIYYQFCKNEYAVNIVRCHSSMFYFTIAMRHARFEHLGRSPWLETAVTFQIPACSPALGL